MTCAASASMEADDNGLTMFLAVFSMLKKVSLVLVWTEFGSRSVC